MRIIGLLLLAVAAGASYFYFYPNTTQTEQVRYRLTATVATPEGPRVGKGVWGYSMAAEFNPLLSMKWYFAGRIDGEAIPIEIGHGQTLYVVLGGREMPQDLGGGVQPARFTNGFMNAMPKYRLWTHDYPRPAYFGSDRAGAAKEVAWMKAQRGRTVALDCSPRLHWNSTGECPAIVLADRSGAHITMLDPDNLAAALGPGYHLRGMTMQVVDDPVTRGIEQRLPWVQTSPVRSLTARDNELKMVGFSRHDPARLR